MFSTLATDPKHGLYEEKKIGKTTFYIKTTHISNTHNTEMTHLRSYHVACHSSDVKNGNLQVKCKKTESHVNVLKEQFFSTIRSA